LIILLPIFLLLGLIFSFTLSVYRIRHVDYEKIYLYLKDYLEKNKGDVSASVKEGALYIGYDYHIEHGSYKSLNRELFFNPLPDDYLVYVYGSSPIISKPPFFRGNFPFFPSVLEAKLNSAANKRNFKVFNFGMGSFDSFDIKDLIDKTVSIKKPDFIILYDCSASDFECAYFNCVKKNFYFINSFIKRLGALFVLKRAPRIGELNRLADWFLRAYIEPNLLNMAQRAQLIRIPPEPFKKYNALVFSFYKKNIYDIIRFAQDRKIPLVIITLLANLESRPYGIYNITEACYRQGMREKDYLRRLDYLTQAKDSEIFTGDIGGPRTKVHDFLKSLREEGVYVLDLQKPLQEKQFDFSYKYFYDVGHMKPDLHKMIAQQLYEFLKGNNLLK